MRMGSYHIYGLTLLICLLAGTGVLGAEVVDRIVAVVNDDIITLQELDRRVGPFEEKIKAAAYSDEKQRQMIFKLRGDILNQLIDQKLTDQEIKRYRLSVADQEIDEAVERIKSSNFFTDEQLRAALAGQGLTLEGYREDVRKQILRAKLVNLEIKSRTVITNADIQAYYDAHPEKYAGKKKYHLRNIIMKPSGFADAEDQQAVRQKMAAVLDRLKGGEDFASLAALYSESSLAVKGGDLGRFELDEISPKLQAAIGQLKAGEFTPVLDTDQGYQIFFVQDIEVVGATSFEDAREDIERQLFEALVDKKFDAWLEDLRKRSHIKIIQ